MAAPKVLEGLSPQRGKQRPSDILLQTVTWVPNPEVELPCSRLDPVDSSLPQRGLPDRLKQKQVTRLDCLSLLNPEAQTVMLLL